MTKYKPGDRVIITRYKVISDGGYPVITDKRVEIGAVVVKAGYRNVDLRLDNGERARLVLPDDQGNIRPE